MKTKLFILAMVVVFAVNKTTAQTLNANLDATTVKWTGTKVVGSSHYGYIKLKDGNLELEKGHINTGHFTIDIKSMTNTDIENQEYNQKLIGHLLSDDFFGAEKYPTAFLKITSASKFKANKASVKGELTIKGETLPIEFEVEKKETDFMASISIDRTQYGIRYGSGSFFDNLGDKAIDNDFTLDVKLVLE